MGGVIGECLISKFVLVRHFRNDHQLNHPCSPCSLSHISVSVWFVGGEHSHDHEICGKFTDGSAILLFGRKADPLVSIARVV